MVDRRIFIDLDGVLADLYQSILRMLGRSLPDGVFASDWDMIEKLGYTRAAVEPLLDYDFWATLQPFDDFDDIMSTVESLSNREIICVLTTTVKTRGCIEGKRLWVDKFMPRGYASRIYFAANKAEYATSDSLLIDDLESECRNFFDSSGRTFLFPRRWNQSFAKNPDWKPRLTRAVQQTLIAHDLEDSV